MGIINWAQKGRNPNRVYEDLKEVSQRARAPYDKDTWLNLAFYLDEQYVEWSDDIQNVREIKRTEREEQYLGRPVANKIMHFVNQSHAFILSQKLQADVLPATDDYMDLSDADVANAYLRYVISPQVTNFPRELDKTALWALVACDAYMKWTWNAEKNQPDIMFVPSLDLYQDPYPREFRSCKWAIHSTFMDPEEVYNLWGKEVPTSKVEKADLSKMEFTRDLGYSPVMEGCTVNELWMLPNRRFPDGKFCIWSGHETLDEGPFPYSHKRLPFTQVGAIPRPNSQHFASPVKYLISPQRELNLYHAQKILTRKNFANLKWYIDTQLELNELPDDSPNQVLLGNSAGTGIEPKILQPGPMPENGDGQWIVEEMQHIVGQHEVSQGQVPGRVEAARAIELLRESDSSRLRQLLDSIQYSVEEGFWQVLRLAQQYVSTPQIVQTYSREGVAEVKHFKGNMIQEGTGVKVTMGSGLAHSRAARADQLGALWDRGIIRDPEVYAQLLELPTPTIVTPRSFDIKESRNENLELAKGTAIEPNSWDDHEIHVREHNNFRKTSDFLTLPMDTKQKFEHHVQRHEELFVAQLQKEIEKQQLVAVASGQAQPAPGPMQSSSAQTASEQATEPTDESSSSAPPAAA